MESEDVVVLEIVLCLASVGMMRWVGGGTSCCWVAYCYLDLCNGVRCSGMYGLNGEIFSIYD